MLFTLGISLRGWVLIGQSIYNKLIGKIYRRLPIAAYIYLDDGNIEIGTTRYKKWDEIPKIHLPYTIHNDTIIETGKLLAEPIKYNDMRNLCDQYYAKITSNIPEYVKYDSENQIMLTSFTWWCHGNHIFFNETKKKINEFPDHGILTIKFYSDQKCTNCIHDGWTISVKTLKQALN